MNPSIYKYQSSRVHCALSDACYVTLDRNSASTELQVSEDGRRALRQWREHPYPAHPERFQRCPQVLCREALCWERFYWEVEWSGGGADIGGWHLFIGIDAIAIDQDDCKLCMTFNNLYQWFPNSLWVTFLWVP